MTPQVSMPTIPTARVGGGIATSDRRRRWRPRVWLSIWLLTLTAGGLVFLYGPPIDGSIIPPGLRESLPWTSGRATEPPSAPAPEPRGNLEAAETSGADEPAPPSTEGVPPAAPLATAPTEPPVARTSDAPFTAPTIPETPASIKPSGPTGAFAQETRPRAAVLAPSMGSLHVNARPWADVWVDGRMVGTTPLANLQVPVGLHEVVWRHPQLGERRETVQVTASSAVRIGMDLRR